MALINTLRNRLGKIVVFVLALTMVAFILSEFLGNNSLFFGQNRDIAEIDGSSITMEDFQNQVEGLSNRFTTGAGRRPQAQEMDRIREQAWNALIIQNLYEKQLSTLGITVSVPEQIDLLQGTNIHPQIIQFFSDENGFNPTLLNEQLVRIREQGTPQERAAWSQFESNLATSRRFSKLNALIQRTNYVTAAEARSEYEDQNAAATIEYVYVPYSAISDENISVSDEELEAYLDENEFAYQKDPSRDLAYVSFPIAPSVRDSADIKNEMNSVRDQFSSVPNDSIFAQTQTDGGFPFVSYRRHEVPGALVAEGETAEVGKISEPVIDGESLVVYKLSQVEEGPEYYTKVRHILVKWTDESDEAKSEARGKANEVLRRARGGEDFSALAAAESEDLSNAQRGGDLGWIGESVQFAEPFKEAVFNHSGEGVIPRLVETQFGFHIIKLDEPKTNEVYKVAVVQKDFIVSTETIDSINREADLFYSKVSTYEEFKSLGEEKGFEVREVKEIPTTSERLGSLSNARSVVLWLYNEASEGEISRQDTEDAFVVAIMIGEQEEGVARLSAVREELTTKVRDKKKGQQIAERLTPHLQKSMADMVSAYGAGATTSEATFNRNAITISGIGPAPEVAGLAFGMEIGSTSDIQYTDQGVVVFTLVTRSEAPESDDLSVYAQQLMSRFQARQIPISDFPLTSFPIRVSQRIDDALKELSELEDKRYKFY